MSLFLLLDGDQKTESEVLSCGTSGIYSLSVSAASESFMSPPLTAVDSLHNICESSYAEQCSLLSASVDAPSRLPSCVHEWEQSSPVASASHGNREVCLLANDTTDYLSDLDKALLKVEHVEAMVTNSQSLAANFSLHESNDSVIDSLSKINAAPVESDGLQDGRVKVNRALHGRSASESGIVKFGHCFTTLPEHVNVHRRYDQGTDYRRMLLYVQICVVCRKIVCNI